MDARLPAAKRELAITLGSLTPAQFQVLSLVSSGLLNKQIAHELDISEATVKAHMSAVLRKLGVNTRTQAVMRPRGWRLILNRSRWRWPTNPAEPQRDSLGGNHCLATAPCAKPDQKVKLRAIRQKRKPDREFRMPASPVHR